MSHFSKRFLSHKFAIVLLCAVFDFSNELFQLDSVSARLDRNLVNRPMLLRGESLVDKLMPGIWDVSSYAQRTAPDLWELHWMDELRALYAAAGVHTRLVVVLVWVSFKKAMQSTVQSNRSVWVDWCAILRLDRSWKCELYWRTTAC